MQQDPLDFHNDVLECKSRRQYNLEMFFFLCGSSSLLVNNPLVLLLRIWCIHFLLVFLGPRGRDDLNNYR